MGDPSHLIDPNGDFALHQLYAQYVRLADPAGRYPQPVDRSAGARHQGQFALADG
jgi:hypothetical protein